MIIVLVYIPDLMKHQTKEYREEKKRKLKKKKKRRMRK